MASPSGWGRESFLLLTCRLCNNASIEGEKRLAIRWRWLLLQPRRTWVGAISRHISPL